MSTPPLLRNVVQTSEGLMRSIVEWHESNGGHDNNGLLPHALRAYREMCELCLKLGASASDLVTIACDEVADETRKGVYGKARPAEIGEEIADVRLLLDIVSHYGDIDQEGERRAKHLINVEQRKWQADADGVLWRPKNPA